LETAYLLGFADPSNFFRAFRRWFDATPGEYRARIGTSTPVPALEPDAEASVSDARTPAYTAPVP
ncbi:MAG: helix-turn-helix domain-containing protein, partial [Pseudomonas sp.]